MKLAFFTFVTLIFGGDVYSAVVKIGTPVCTGDNCGGNSLLDATVHKKTVLNPAEEKTELTQTTISSVEKLPNQKQTTIKRKAVAETNSSSNLPDYYASSDRDIEISNASRVLESYKESPEKLRGVHAGDVYSALIEQEIVCSAATKAPIRALITSGKMRGSLLVGEASLDPELKRVLLNFNKIRPKGVDTVFDIQAVGLSRTGSIGIVGSYHSNSGKFFIAELLAGATAGFVDATIPRSQNALGNYVQEISVQNSGKAAAISALAKTTERMADQVRKAPEYTRVQGYQEIRILFQSNNNQ